MKKILIILSLLISNSSFSQIDVNTLNEVEKKIVKTFRDLYVEKEFKDPYSFELMKLEITPRNIGEDYLSQIDYIKSKIEKKDFKYTTKEYEIEHLKKLEFYYSQLNDSSRNILRLYKVKLDSRGTNSYGGKVLSRYSFDYYLFDKDFKPINYYEKPILFFVLELN
jgi:hypothetical protein